MLSHTSSYDVIGFALSRWPPPAALCVGGSLGRRGDELTLRGPIAYVALGVSHEPAELLETRPATRSTWLLLAAVSPLSERRLANVVELGELTR